MGGATILFVAANPTSAERILLDHEYKALEKQLRLSVHRDAVELDSLWATSPLDLTGKLNDARPTVVHFAGHGTRDGLLLVDELGGHVSMSGKALRVLLAEFPATIKLVVLNACYSDEIASEIVDVVGCVIGTPGAIGDQTARTFSEAFYAALCAGLSVASAYKQAIVLCGLQDGPGATRDVGLENAPAPDKVAVLRHRHDVDPEQVRLIVTAQQAATIVESRNRISPRVIGASVVVVASIAAAVMLWTRSPASSSVSPLQAPRSPCRNRFSHLSDETVRGPITVVASTDYAAFVHAKCLDGPCNIEIVDRGTSIQNFALAKNQEWTGYYKLLGADLRVVDGLAQVMSCILRAIPDVSPAAAFTQDAIAAARDGDCMRVVKHSFRVKHLDADYYRAKFVSDAAIAQCLQTLRADVLMEQARAAARGGDCKTVVQLGDIVKHLDADYYRAKFVNDAAIAQCLQSLRADVLMEQAGAAARDGDCKTVVQLGDIMEQLEGHYYRAVFLNNAAIARCLPESDL